jgi:hypothetical protein
VSGEIEFIDLEPAPEAVGAGERTAHRSDAWNAGAVLGWTVGAALATAVDSILSGRDPSFAAPTVSYGPFLWCCLAAVVCGLAGTLARIVAARGRSGAGA